jgi:hypothetical protein
MSWAFVQTFVTNNFKYVVFMVALVLLVLAYDDIRDKVTTTQSTVEHLEQGFDVKLNRTANKVEMLGQRLDSNGTYIASTRYLTDPGFFSRLISANAREQKRMYDSVLALIPEAVRLEFNRTSEKPREIGVTNVVIDSVLIEVKVGNSVKFARGSLLYVADSNLYKLSLYRDVIEITDIRGEVHDDGFLLSTVTAKSKLTGESFDVVASHNFLNWEKSAWDLRPSAFLFAGPMWKYDGGRAPDVIGGIEWIRYKMGSWEWIALHGEVTPVGVALRTGITYKF